ncbi:hypothetical protein M378DRAFT_158478, partial [Amanita muscaria Koide BX008]
MRTLQALFYLSISPSSLQPAVKYFAIGCQQLVDHRLSRAAFQNYYSYPAKRHTHFESKGTMVM